MLKMIVNYGVNNRYCNRISASPSNNPINSANDTAFGSGRAKKVGKKLCKLMIMSEICMAVTKFSIAGALFTPNEKQISNNICWEPNVRVISSTGQNSLGLSGPGSSFSRHLTDLLEQKKLQTVEQANDSLSKSGYRIKRPPPSLLDYLNFNFFIDRTFSNNTFYPLETPGQKLNIFNKEEKNKNRFILILPQSGFERFEKESKDFSEKMKKIYDIPDANIVSAGIKTSDDLERGVDSITRQINALKDKSNTELLVIYDGHGSSISLRDGARKSEGAMQGIIVENIKEPFVKKLFKEQLAGVKTLFVLDTCNSGAWIAEAPKDAAKALSRLV